MEMVHLKNKGVKTILVPYILPVEVIPNRAEQELELAIDLGRILSGEDLLAVLRESRVARIPCAIEEVEL